MFHDFAFAHGPRACGSDSIPLPIAHEVDETTAAVIPHDEDKEPDAEAGSE